MEKTHTLYLFDSAFDSIPKSFFSCRCMYDQVLLEFSSQRECAAYLGVHPTTVRLRTHNLAFIEVKIGCTLV